MGWPGQALTLQRPVLTWDTLVSGPAMRWGPWAFSGVDACWRVDGTVGLLWPPPCPRLGRAPGAHPAPLVPGAAEECLALHQPGVSMPGFRTSGEMESFLSCHGSWTFTVSWVVFDFVFLK